MNMRFILVTLTFSIHLLSCFPSIASSVYSPRLATENEAKDLKKIVSLHTHNLIERGLRVVGTFDLVAYEKQVEDLKFEISPIALNTQGRFGFRNFPAKRTIVVSVPELERSTPFELQALLLHESLCALGYADQASEISSSVIALSSVSVSDKKLLVLSTMLTPVGSKPAVLPPLVFRTDLDTVQKLNLSTYKRLARSGGSTEGGHGGDPTGIRLKSLLIFSLLTERAPEPLISFVIHRLDIEQYEGADAYICPYDESTFEHWVKLDTVSQYLVVRVPMACRNERHAGKLLSLLKITVAKALDSKL